MRATDHTIFTTAMALWLWSVPVSSQVQPGSESAATYRMEVSAAELDSWLEFRGNSPFLRGQSAIDGLVLVKSLAERAVTDGREGLPTVRAALDRAAGHEALLRLRSHTAGLVAVTQDEVDALLESAPPAQIPRRIRLRNLFRRLPEDPTAAGEVRREMEAYRRQIHEGADFATLAERHSESETRWKGGLLGNVRPGTFRPEIQTVAESLAPGEVSEVLPTADGLTLLYCEAILPAVDRLPEDRARVVYDRIWRQRFQQRWRDLREKLLVRARITYVETAGTAHLGDDPIVVSFDGGHLTSSALGVLTGNRSQPSGIEAVRKSATQIEEFAIGQMAIRHLAELGQTPDRQACSEARWRRLQILASEQLAALVATRFDEPDPEEVRKHFDRNKDSFLYPELWSVSLIQLDMDPRDPREDVDRAAKLLRSLRSGEVSFEEAAELHSLHPSAERGGRIVGIPKARLTPIFGLDLARALNAVEPGEISELVTSEESLWIVRVDRIEDERPARFEEASSEARASLIQKRLDEHKQQIADEWLDRLEIRYAADS
ncbi:MAG: peptidylprolyl isomerase [Thermoanaerobaculia bacterium]|nr:peptidylprolyl isomerase [Thermoanaerobaculia bacterium]